MLYLTSITSVLFLGLYYIKFAVLQIQDLLPKEIVTDVKDLPPAAFLFSPIVFVLGFTMSKYAFDFYLKQRNTDKLHKENLISELDILKSQINPHFLFNALNTIYGLSICLLYTSPSPRDA